MRLEIQLLGAVELSVAGRPVAMGAPKRRAVLAGLALDANRPVSLRRLVDMAWADAPPASAIANLRSHVAALRAAVGDRIVAYSGAYQIRLAPDELDVTEFARLAHVGQASMAAEDFHAAIPPLAAALALCRGASGGGVPRGTTLDSHWVALDEQRLQVFDDLMRARLAAGENASLIGGLRRHLAAHPLRERTWAQLMLALYRSGDTSAALTAYREARAVLDEQLGIEPGAELVRLQRAVLERSADLLPPEKAPPHPGRPPHPGPPPEPGRRRAGSSRRRPPWLTSIALRPGSRRPRELPADVVAFVGRDRELAAVMETLRAPAPPVVVISGPAGCGKSALAVRAAHLLEPAFPDGQIYIDLGYRPTVLPGEVIARALRALGVVPREVPISTDERAGRLRSLVAGRRLLLVVDGVGHAGLVRPLLPAGPGPALVAIGQRRIRSLDGAVPVILGPMGPADAFALLAAHTGTERLSAEPDATADLIRLCAGSPLALRIAGARLADRPEFPIDGAAELLRDPGERLDWLVYEDLSVRESLETAHAVLGAADELAARALVLLGGHRSTPQPADRVAVNLGVSAVRAAQALDALVDAHLAYHEASGYRLRPLVLDYAVGIAAGSGGQRPSQKEWRSGSLRSA